MSGEAEDGVENDIESDVQHTRSRPLLPRTSKDPTEPVEPETSTTTEKTVNQRSSNRITKRARRDSSPVDATIKKAVTIKQSTPVTASKTRRPWELWSVEDKDAFFEALSEFGKDFENIQSYIAQRSKKKGVVANMIKNKDQVRHFYYRTWHKISKFLQISESVTKQTQELYGLINYGELRKKIGGCLNEKNRQKLNELVFTGVTTVKHKGKRLRIKTPVCRALKKLNNVTDTKEPETEKMPKEIVVEFRPHTNAAFLQVQTLAQNPRVRTKLTLQKRLKTVIEFLQNRWKPYRLKRKEQILASLPSLASQVICDNDTPPVLRVKPPRDAKIFPLSLSVMDVASSSDVCLEKFMELSYKTVRKDMSKTKKSLCLNQKILNDKQSEICETEKQESVSEGTEECTDNAPPDSHELCLKTGNKNSLDDGVYFNVLTPPKSVPEELPSETFVESQKSISLFSSILEIPNKKPSANSNDDLVEKSCDENANSYLPELNFRSYEDNTVKCVEDNCKTMLTSKAIDYEKDMVHCPNIPENITLGEFLGSKADQFSIHNLQLKHNLTSDSPQDSKDEQDTSDNIYYKIIRNGWTVEEAGYLTFGEIYLLLGKPIKIILEYEFEPPETVFADDEKVCNSNPPPPTEMNIILNKMCELAQIYFTDSKSKQILNKLGRSSKSSKMKVPLLTEKISKDQPSSSATTNIDSTQVNKDSTISKEASLKSSMNSVNSAGSSQDKHVFIRPVGTAPRNIKPPDQNSLKEEIGKLLPSTRRGCRVRRKPLVVQRPLLPREGMGVIPGSRPMTLVHLVPSVSSLATVIPSNCTQSENKICMPAAKKIMNILPQGSSIDIHPIQVPVISQMQSDSGQNLVLQQNSHRVIVNSTSRNPLQILSDQTISPCLTPISSAISSSDSLMTMNENSATLENSFIPEAGLSSPNILDVLNFDLLSESQESSVPDESFVNIPSSNAYQLSDQSDSLSNISAIPDSSFLEELGFSTKRPMFDSSGSSNFNEDPLSSKPLSTPPGSPIPQSFLMDSPDRQWLNGESPDLSLNTFLNSMESPSKMLSPSTSSSFTENSNFDQIARLAPVVDSQVRCLLDECSIDFIAKFEDLADVINNSSSNDGKQT